MDTGMFSRRQVILAAGAGLAGMKSLSAESASPQDAGLTSRQVVERIQKNVGIPWREQTVDNFKDGSNPDEPVTGIATTMVATFERQCCNFEVAAQEMHDADVFRQIVIWNSLAMKWSWRTI